MNVDVEIYMNNFIKFFRENPNDLFTLIPKGTEDEFYKKIKEVSLKNIESGDDPSLTQKQILDICVVINGKDPNKPNKKLEKYITTPQVAAPAVQSEPTCSEDRYYKLQFAKNAPRDVCTGHPVEYLGAVMQA